MKLLVVAATCLALAAAVHDRVISVESFDGFKVYRAFPEDQDLDFMRKFENNGVYDFWTEVRKGKPVDIMVPPSSQATFTRQLTERGVRHEVMIPNVQALIDLEKAQSKLGVKGGDHDMTWTEYHPLEDMYSYLDHLEANFEWVTTQSIGKSGEGRDMRIAKICKSGECGNKPAIWIDGGIHAREWISPATVTWMLKELVENDADHPDLTENMDWYFLPSHNPDGYAFSREENRMWRKTRSDHGSIFGCMGVDANRNWGYQFNTGGSSNDKCSDTYHGPEAFSEVENTNVRDFVLSVKDQLVFYNSIHSYSQLILLPWGYTSNPPDNYDYMEAIALKGSDALTAVHGKFYETGCIPCMLYIASGSSADWALGAAGIQFSISMELRDTGSYGFILPPDQIIPTAEEVWAFHITAIREIYSQLP